MAGGRLMVGGAWRLAAMAAALLALGAASAAPVTRVVVDATIRRAVGGVSLLDRQRYLNVHNPTTVPDPALQRYVAEELRTQPGRHIGGINWWASQALADPERPGFVAVSALRNAVARRGARPDDRPASAFVISGNAGWPEWLRRPVRGQLGWLPDAEAYADFLDHYLTLVAQPAAEPDLMLEVINEPNAQMEQHRVTVPDVIALHKAVARRLRATHPELRIGGPTDCWPEYAARDFGVWDWFMRPFMDGAGDDLDFWSLHVYDHLNWSEAGETGRRRTAAETSAILDLVESWSKARFGTAKRLVISEYGATTASPPAYSRARRQWAILRSVSEKLFVFLERPDRIAMATPYIMIHAPWEPDGVHAFYNRLGDRLEESHLTKLYRLWRDVRGSRLMAQSDAPELQVAAFAEGTEVFLCLNNLAPEPRPITVTAQLGASGGISTTSVSRLRQANGVPQLLVDQPLTASWPEFVLAGEEAAVVKLTTTARFAPAATVDETTHYADSTLLPITAGEVRLRIAADPAGAVAARLRLSYSRPGDAQPPKLAVTLNGHVLDVPASEAGAVYTAFSTRQINVPPAWLRAENELGVAFPGPGGRLSSAVLVVGHRVPPTR